MNKFKHFILYGRRVQGACLPPSRPLVSWGAMISWFFQLSPRRVSNYNLMILLFFSFFLDRSIRMLFSYLLISNWALPYLELKKKTRVSQDTSHRELEQRRFFLFFFWLFHYKIIELTIRAICSVHRVDFLLLNWFGINIYFSFFTSTIKWLN